ncbi:MAG: hypothetical protein Q8940_17720 [Bacteroidota bacterium]|nr:hypothetical protein [Bacteroidota bacterium]
MTDTKKLMSIKDFAALKKCSERTIYNNIKFFKTEQIGRYNFIVLNKMAIDWEANDKMKRPKKKSS